MLLSLDARARRPASECQSQYRPPAELTWTAKSPAADVRGHRPHCKTSLATGAARGRFEILGVEFAHDQDLVLRAVGVVFSLIFKLSRSCALRLVARCRLAATKTSESIRIGIRYYAGRSRRHCERVVTRGGARVHVLPDSCRIACYRSSSLHRLWPLRFPATPAAAQPHPRSLKIPLVMTRDFRRARSTRRERHKRSTADSPDNDQRHNTIRCQLRNALPSSTLDADLNQRVPCSTACTCCLPSSLIQDS